MQAISPLHSQCRQGDPIASALFILCIEILYILRKSESVKGINIGSIEVFLSLYDCCNFLKYDSQNLRNAIQILNNLHEISGLQIQVKKTQFTVFGTIPDDYILCRDIGLK